MSQVQLDREFFGRFLERFFELEIDNRAYRALAARAARQKPESGLRYAAFQDAEVDEQQKQFEEIRRSLNRELAAEDDAAFQRTLSSLFPPR